MTDRYHHRRKNEHRSWLRDFKQRCVRCGETTPHKLTVLDAETGRGLGLSEGGWSLPTTRRDELVERSIVLCHSCGYRYRRERHEEDH